MSLHEICSVKEEGHKPFNHTQSKYRERRNDGSVYTYTDSANVDFFYMDFNSGSLIEEKDGGYYNFPINAAERNFGYSSSASHEVGLGRRKLKRSRLHSSLYVNNEDPFVCRNHNGSERRESVKRIMGQKEKCSQTFRGHIVIFSAVFAFTSLFCTPQPDAKIFQWVDAKGVNHYSNVPPSKDRDVRKVFDEYEHDEAAHQERIRSDQKEMDAQAEQFGIEKQQALAEEQRKSVEQQERLAEAIPYQRYWFDSGCFSPSYSVQQGKGVSEKITPRDISEGEHKELKKLFEELDGSWSGDGWTLYCEEWAGRVIEQMEHFSIKSDCTTNSTGLFVLETELYSRENRVTADQTLQLYLSEDKLFTGLNIQDSDVEVISVSSGELIYLEKRLQRTGGYRGGGRLTHETVTTIKKTGKASFSLQRVLYLRGRLQAKHIWYQKGG